VVSDQGYEVIITPPAERSLNQIQSEAVLTEAVDLIDALKDDPFPAYARALAERERLWVFDFGDAKYRLVYQVSKKQKKIIIKAVGLRKDVYGKAGLYRKDEGL
jgi:mRNA-degrading endonuclease RelE of RelBE toxin-antitoxin system